MIQRGGMIDSGANIVTIYLHSVTLAHVMSQTIDLRIERLSIISHLYY